MELWLICGLPLLAMVPAAIADSRGRSFALWWLYGFLVLPIAFIHALTLSPNDRALARSGRAPCPYCAEMIKPEAAICPHCRSDLRSLRAQASAAEQQSAPPCLSAGLLKEDRKRGWILLAVLVIVVGISVLLIRYNPDPRRGVGPGYELISSVDRRQGSVVLRTQRIRARWAISSAEAKSIADAIVAEQCKLGDFSGLMIEFFSSASDTGSNPPAWTAVYAPDGEWSHSAGAAPGDYSRHRLLVR